MTPIKRWFNTLVCDKNHIFTIQRFEASSMLLFSYQISCIISVKMLSAIPLIRYTCEYRLLGMINDRKEFQ